MSCIDTLYGPVDLPDWPNDLIVRALRTHGEWARTEAALAASVIPEGARLWDLGAFLGTFSMGVARHRQLSSVLAVEANPALADPLRANLTRNLDVPSVVFSGGIGPRPGWIGPSGTEVPDDNHGAQSFTFLTEPVEGAIACTALPALRARHGGYDVLKLDLEGMEREVMMGDRDYLRENQPVIWTECNEAMSSLSLYEALRWLGYRIGYVAFPAFRRDNFLNAADLIHPQAYEAALLAAPAALFDRFSPDAGKQEVIFRVIESTFDLRKALFDTPRWGHPEWQDLSRPELLARMGRIMQGSRLQEFLNPAPPKE